MLTQSYVELEQVWNVATDETQYVNCDNIVQHIRMGLCNATCFMFGNTPT